MDPKSFVATIVLELSIQTGDVIRSILNARKKTTTGLAPGIFHVFLLVSSVVQSSLVCQVFN